MILILEPEKGSLQRDFESLIDDLRSWLDSTTGESSNTTIANTLGVQRAWIERRLQKDGPQKVEVKKMDVFALRYVVDTWSKTKGELGFTKLPLLNMYLDYNDKTQEALKL